jgi:hypothetical protein
MDFRSISSVDLPELVNALLQPLGDRQIRRFDDVAAGFDK